MRVGYLGPEGTFSEEAAHTAPAADGAQLVGLPTIRDTVMAVHAGDVERAVVPIENSLEGPVGVTLDTLAGEATDVTIVGEVVLPVSQCLIARAPIELSAIERVISHPQATAQCAGFLRERLPQATIAPATSTAEAVRQIVASTRPWAAISTLRAAEVYGATVLLAGIEDEPGNATRFVWLERRSASAPRVDASNPAASAPAGPAAASDAGPPDPSRPFKTSLAFWGLGDESPGWLVRCLSEFAFRRVEAARIARQKGWL